MSHPRAHGKPFGQCVRETPEAREGPNQQPQKTHDHGSGAQYRGNKGNGTRRSGAASASPCHNPSTAQGCCHRLHHTPHYQTRDHQKQLPNSPRRGDETQSEVRIVHPAQDLHRKRGRSRRTKNDRHVNHRHGKRQNGVNGQSDLRVDARKDRLKPCCHWCVAQSQRRIPCLPRWDLRQRCERHQKKKRHLFDDQTSDQR